MWVNEEDCVACRAISKEFTDCGDCNDRALEEANKTCKKGDIDKVDRQDPICQACQKMKQCHRYHYQDLTYHKYMDSLIARQI